MLEAQEVKDYVEHFLNFVFKDEINIKVEEQSYLINNKLNVKMYRFWEKDYKSLLEDFEGYSFKNDYIGTIFFFLSGYWEYINNDKRDIHGRFPSKESFSYKKNILEEPIVDIIVNKISQKLNLAYREFFCSPKFLITHDIDYLSLLDNKRFISSLGGDILLRKNLKMALDKVRKKINKDDPHSISRLLNIHKKYNTKGIFFFLTDFQPSNTKGGYNLYTEKNRLKEIKEEIVHANCNIGIHYDSRYLETDRLKSDIEKLEDIFKIKIISGRAHYLKFDITKSFDLYEKYGILIDTTGLYADAIGFRFGTSYPFIPYNFKEKRMYNVLEVP